MGRVKLYLDSAAVPGWNEIDAVGLVSRDGATLCASSATASSFYGSMWLPAKTGAAVELLPPWGHLAPPSPAFAANEIKNETRVIDGWGWPCYVAWGEAAAGSGRMPFGGFRTAGRIPSIPWHPVWPGLLINGALCALVLAGLWRSVSRPRRFVRELSRLRRGCCIRCGYDLGYNFSPGYPEFGWRRDR